MAFTTFAALGAPKAMSGNVKTSSSTKSKVQSMYAKNIKTGKNTPVHMTKLKSTKTGLTNIAQR